MKKIIKQWGASMVVLIDPEDAQILKIKAGDIVEVSITKTKERIQ